MVGIIFKAMTFDRAGPHHFAAWHAATIQEPAYDPDGQGIFDRRGPRRCRTADAARIAHVEFTRDGRYALVSIWEDDGAVIVYDAATLEELRRLPMRKPSGKYNVWNKITFSEGTSH